MSCCIGCIAMSRATRSLTDTDRALWARYTRRVRPLSGLSTAYVTIEPPGAVIAPPKHHLQQSGSDVSKPSYPLVVGEAPAGLDAATWRRFRSGRLPAARRLDLHGYPAERAFHALTAFLRSAHADRLRCVEVVTGRGGSGETAGLLRRELPVWLNRPDIRPGLLAAAHPHVRNPGSVRLLLRRSR